ncbi:hypothetical protein TWF718_008564 [Orbilia javanica]|uniref:RelA/SpoT domain-containing protein n=1 Tax=Orbilia javanica TaxID=47235 RepID=A0AAN8RFH7_9PEZI
MSNNKAIDQYMTQYNDLTEALAIAAESIGALCRSALADSGILANVTCRAKDSSRLRTKLENRLQEKLANKEQPYKTIEDVENDLVDIIGVRVMLYFPTQAEAVEKLFARMFTKADIKRMPTTKGDPSKSLDSMAKFFQDGSARKVLGTSNSIAYTGDFTPSFGGYRAIHIRCTAQPNDLVDEVRIKFTERKLKTEIQIQSLLMHAWSEVNHDLAYKTLSGKVSDEETRLLDFINGIGQMGELALLKLKSILDARVKVGGAYSGLAFASPAAIAEFIRQFLNQQYKDQANVFDLGDLEEFLYFLTYEGLNNEVTLGQWLTKCNMIQKLDDTKIPIIGTILDAMLRVGGDPSTELIRMNDNTRTFHPFIRPQMNKALTGPKVQIENRYEIVATVLDLAYRPLLQAAPQELVGCTFNKLIEMDLYTYPNASRYKGARYINKEKVRDTTVWKMICEVAEWFAKSQSPVVKYHIHIARISVCRVFANARYFEGLNF